jgi:hypothetical protein
MTPLREKFIEDMRVRGLAPTTQRSYLHHAVEYTKYFNRSPEQLDCEAIHPGEIETLKQPAAWVAYLAPLKQTEWVVYAKKPFGGPPQVLEYLGRYTHRVALSNDRILDVSQGGVTFQWRDYRCKDKYKSRTMTVAANEFIRRFLIHTLPAGFQRIRYFGFLANRFRKQKLALCRKLLSNAAAELLPTAAQCAELAATWDRQAPRLCPQCRTGILIRIAILPAYHWPARPPDSS